MDKPARTVNQAAHLPTAIWSDAIGIDIKVMFIAARHPDSLMS